MNKSKEDTEFRFLEKIDCNFPYSNLETCYELIDEAKSISPNAIFSIIEELARITVSDRKIVSESYLIKLLEKTIEDFDHPILDSIVRTAKLMIANKEQSVDSVLQLMKDIEKHPGQWGALSTVYFSCDDIDGTVDSKFDEIRNKWNS